MKLYYLTTPDFHKAGQRFFSESHYFVLSSGEILLAAEFDNDQAEGIWSSQPGVTSLPYDRTVAIGPEIAARLSDLCSPPQPVSVAPSTQAPSAPSATPTLTVSALASMNVPEIASLATAFHPLMGCVTN
jgi:hypothetical protein